MSVCQPVWILNQRDIPILLYSYGRNCKGKDGVTEVFFSDKGRKHQKANLNKAKRVISHESHGTHFQTWSPHKLSCLHAFFFLPFSTISVIYNHSFLSVSSSSILVLSLSLSVASYTRFLLFDFHRFWGQGRTPTWLCNKFLCWFPLRVFLNGLCFALLWNFFTCSLHLSCIKFSLLFATSVLTTCISH